MPISTTTRSDRRKREPRETTALAVAKPLSCACIGDNGGLPLEPIAVTWPLEPLAVTFPTGKKISGLGLTTLWKLGKEGRIELVRVNRRTLITFRSLKALLTP